MFGPGTAADPQLAPGQRLKVNEARLESPLHSKVDDIGVAYTALADDSSRDMQRREAALLVSTAEGYLEDENASEALKTATDSLQKFRDAGDSNAQHDALRVIINAHRLESELAFSNKPVEAERVLEEEYTKFAGKDDKRGTAAMLLARAECMCDHRQTKTSELDDAENWARQALTTFREIDDKKMVATALLELAHIHSLKSDANEVFEAANEARQFFKALDDKKGDARALHGVAFSSILQRKFPDALGKMKEVLAMFKELGIKKYEAYELCAMAEVHLEDEKPLRALPIARQALSMFREINYGKGWEAACLLAVSRSLIDKHQTKQAIQAVKEGIDRFKQINDKRQEVFGLEILADAQMAADSHDDALESMDRAIEVTREIADKHLEIDVLHMTMWCHMGLREFDKAVDQMEDALVLAQELGDSLEEAAAVHNIAYCSLLKDEKKTAIDRVDEAKSLYASIEDKKGEASACIIAAVARTDPDELETAVEQGVKAKDLYNEAKDMPGEANACKVLAELLLAQDKVDDALQMAQRRLDLMQEYASKKGEAGAMAQLANIYLACENYPKAEQAAADAKKLGAAVADRRAEAEAQLLLTQVYIGQNADRPAPERGAHPLEKALRTASDAVSLSGKSGDRTLQATARYWRAFLLAQTGRLPDAQRAGEEAKAFYRKAGDDRGAALTLLLQGNIANSLGQKGEAKGFVESALEIASKLGDSALEDDAAKLLDKIEGKGAAAPVVQMAQIEAATTDQAQVAEAAPAASVAAAPKGLDPTYVRKQLMTFVKDVMASDDELELDSPFMEAGMDSLSSVSLMSMVAKEFQMALSPSLVFDFPTVRALEDHLVEESKN